MKNTPGIGGYLVAWAVSVVAFAVLLAGYLGVVSGDGDIAGAVVVFAVYGTFVSVPFALVGIPLVHVACRTVAAQWVHVLVAGAVGLLPLIVLGMSSDAGYDGGSDGPAYLVAWLLVPVATAIGRWCVVPLVPSYRQRRAVAGLSPAARAAS